MFNNLFQKPAPLTKSWVCEILGLPVPETDETYTKIYFAHEVQPGGIAILSVNTSDIHTVTSEKRAVELADQAMKRGAKLLISTFQVKDYPCLIVNDVMDAFCRVVKTIRSQFTPKTIGITGSIGKTTTTQMVYSVINYKYKNKTHRNDSSANNLRLAAGIIQNLKPEHEAYVQEIMEGPPFGTASYISSLVQPQAAVVTLVGSSHMEAFGSQERILESCLGIQDGMPEDGLLILNGDDPFQWNAETRCRKVYYAIENENADYRAVNIHGDGQRLRFDIVHDGIKTPVSIRCFGKHNVLNATAAFAAGKWAGMSDEEAASGLGTFRTEGIRQNYVRYGGKNLFLDCYNAAPESIESSLESLMMIPVAKGGRRIAVLADIAETGSKEREFHLSVGKMAAESKIDALVCYGKNARLIASVALAESGIPVYHTESKEQLVDFLKQNVTNNDVVLYKGSHSMELEHVVDLAYGTWFHEEFERYEFKTHLAEDKDLRYRVYTDHVTVIEKLSNTKDVVIPDSVEGLPVTSIGRSVFYESRYTESIHLPSHLRNIRFCAFYKANHIQTVHIPASVRIVEESAFGDCANLKSVLIENGCTHIGYRAFSNCKSLESITIPPSVQQIDNEVFLNCKKLTISCVAGSYAEKYARSRNINYIFL